MAGAPSHSAWRRGNGETVAYCREERTEHSLGERWQQRQQRHLAAGGKLAAYGSSTRSFGLSFGSGACSVCEVSAVPSGCVTTVVVRSPSVVVTMVVPSGLQQRETQSATGSVELKR